MTQAHMEKIEDLASFVKCIKKRKQANRRRQTLIRKLEQR